MKKGVKIVLIVIGCLIAILLVVLLTNKTFFKDKYKSIPLPTGSYYINSNTFYNIRSFKSIDNDINEYLDTLTSCYDDGYFYDKDLDISIIKYHIQDEGLYNRITLDYEKGNICDVEYTLSDKWYDDIKKNDLKEVEFIQCTENDCLTTKVNVDLDKFIDDVKKFDRVPNKDFVDFEYKDTNNYLGIYFTDDHTYGNAYKLLRYKNYLAVILIDGNDFAKNALYKVDDDANKYIQSLVKE